MMFGGGRNDIHEVMRALKEKAKEVIRHKPGILI